MAQHRAGKGHDRKGTCEYCGRRLMAGAYRAVSSRTSARPLYRCSGPAEVGCLRRSRALLQRELDDAHVRISQVVDRSNRDFSAVAANLQEARQEAEVLREFRRAVCEALGLADPNAVSDSEIVRRAAHRSFQPHQAPPDADGSRDDDREAIQSQPRSAWSWLRSPAV